MLWKDKLCIGVDIIDEQHKELFSKTDDLLKAVTEKKQNQKQGCISAVNFLKDYAVKHFATEEGHLKTIGFPDFEDHKKLHDKFIGTVLHHEKKMLESDFDEKDVKEFTGMLIAWLLYHVADCDQKHGRFARDEKQEKPADAAYHHNEIVCNSISDVLNKMAGLDTSTKIINTHSETFDGSVAVEISLIGDVSGFIAFVYPVIFIQKLINEMMAFTPKTIGELEISALFEMSNIISGTVCGQIGKEKGIFCDIKPPLMISRADIVSDEKVILDTGIGIVETGISIKYA